MKKNLLERHLKAEHSRYVDKDEEFFQQKFDAVNACKLDVSGAVFKSNSAALVEASYMVAYTVAKSQKATYYRRRVSFTVYKIHCKSGVGKEHVKKLSVSDNTMQRRICDIFEQVEGFVVTQRYKKFTVLCSCFG